MSGCAYHCRACNQCFGSLEAFDAHRQFEEGHPNDWDHRVCVHPLDDERFAVKAEHGVCKHARPQKSDTRIWTLEAAQLRWQKAGLG